MHGPYGLFRTLDTKNEKHLDGATSVELMLQTINNIMYDL